MSNMGRLKACLAAGVGVAAAGGTAEAGIVYTPVGVSTGVGGSVPIDFDNDGTPEFTIDHSDAILDGKLTIETGPGATDLMYTGDGSGNVVAQPFGTLIDAFNTTDTIFPGDVDAGLFNPPAGGYIGVKFTLPAQSPTFGWIHVIEDMPPGTLGASNQGFISGYAYQPSGAPIVAGDTGIPEPGTIVLLASGVAGLAALRRRKRQS